MKLIEFKDAATQRVYQNYINRCRRVVEILSAEDQEDCLMEVNSYIYEYTQNHQNDSEMIPLLNILERMGDPEITLKEIVAGKKIDQAVKTFNLKHLVQALFLNLKNGIVYVILAFMTLLLVSFPILIVMEILYPQETGLHVGGRTFIFGITNQREEGVSEVLGDGFIPVVIVLGIAFYFIIIFLLKLIKNKKS